ncbi:16S rRNA (cytosine(967)-C(5))-methyltransferase RsmB [Bacillus sp. FJAT-49711]|uniref:16S rRNA (cytosine(967)-C(5))-methyltransferase RsmB n=1 Tax=Bacillus sp. FJAT-49711 TaxID=2833585 RepID=UPI001BC95551|nr:16S rRNA (cytosine(967)-C(5))-methyltransferase RsmB [Bacillus sp. FJAT-49711]MBS4217799.1 16S rRNA (cytosine(967)-C(5))-methyltransferase RsmB [Bacillus sp. FJAT-49711]
MNKQKKTVREAALDVLEAIDKHQSYSNLLLNQVIKKYQITGPDTGLLTEIVYGTIQRKMTLDFYLQPFIKKKMEHWVLILLRLSLYQMIYLDKVPDRAIIFEAVEIAKKRGHKGIVGLVNGILRSIQREGIRSLDIISDPVERLAIETSHPLWLVQRWAEQFSFDKTKAMCEENLMAPVQTVRINVTKTTREEVCMLLQAEGFSVEASPIIPESIRILKGNAANSDLYKKGYFSIQDESSMVVAYALQLFPNMNVLDACAAPGGKTGHIGELLNGAGKVTALDLHAHKIKLIKENASRLSLNNIDAFVMDSRHSSESFNLESFDRVLIDAPCSGLGVLRKKPDIKYTKTEQDIQSLREVQLRILNETASLLKKGGLLVYSTCTVDLEENFGTAAAFLEQHEDFEPYPLTLPEALSHLVQKGSNIIQIFPQDFGGDGFFISCFRKKQHKEGTIV